MASTSPSTLDASTTGNSSILSAFLSPTRYHLGSFFLATELKTNAFSAGAPTQLFSGTVLLRLELQFLNVTNVPFFFFFFPTARRTRAGGEVVHIRNPGAYSHKGARFEELINVAIRSARAIRRYGVREPKRAQSASVERHAAIVSFKQSSQIILNIERAHTPNTTPVPTLLCCILATMRAKSNDTPGVFFFVAS